MDGALTNQIYIGHTIGSLDALIMPVQAVDVGFLQQLQQKQTDEGRLVPLARQLYNSNTADYAMMQLKLASANNFEGFTALEIADLGYFFRKELMPQLPAHLRKDGNGKAIWQIREVQNALKAYQSEIDADFEAYKSEHVPAVSLTGLLMGLGIIKKGKNAGKIARYERIGGTVALAGLTGFIALYGAAGCISAPHYEDNNTPNSNSDTHHDQFRHPEYDAAIMHYYQTGEGEEELEQRIAQDFGIQTTDPTQRDILIQGDILPKILNSYNAATFRCPEYDAAIKHYYQTGEGEDELRQRIKHDFGIQDTGWFINIRDVIMDCYKATFRRAEYGVAFKHYYLTGEGREELEQRIAHDFGVDTADKREVSFVFDNVENNYLKVLSQEERNSKSFQGIMLRKRDLQRDSEKITDLIVKFMHENLKNVGNSATLTYTVSLGSNNEIIITNDNKKYYLVDANVPENKIGLKPYEALEFTKYSATCEIDGDYTRINISLTGIDTGTVSFSDKKPSDASNHPRIHDEEGLPFEFRKELRKMHYLREAYPREASDYHSMDREGRRSQVRRYIETCNGRKEWLEGHAYIDSEPSAATLELKGELTGAQEVVTGEKAVDNLAWSVTIKDPQQNTLVEKVYHAANASDLNTQVYQDLKTSNTLDKVDKFEATTTIPHETDQGTSTNLENRIGNLSIARVNSVVDNDAGYHVDSNSAIVETASGAGIYLTASFSKGGELASANVRTLADVLLYKGDERLPLFCLPEIAKSAACEVALAGATTGLDNLTNPEPVALARSGMGQLGVDFGFNLAGQLAEHYGGDKGEAIATIVSTARDYKDLKEKLSEVTGDAQIETVLNMFGLQKLGEMLNEELVSTLDAACSDYAQKVKQCISDVLSIKSYAVTLPGGTMLSPEGNLLIPAGDKLFIIKKGEHNVGLGDLPETRTHINGIELKPKESVADAFVARGLPGDYQTRKGYFEASHPGTEYNGLGPQNIGWLKEMNSGQNNENQQQTTTHEAPQPQNNEPKPPKEKVGPIDKPHTEKPGHVPRERPDGKWDMGNGMIAE